MPSRVAGTPMSVIDGHPLSKTAGAVIDPIISLRRCVRLAPGASAQVTFSTLIAQSRDEALTLADEYNNPATFERAATLAWTQAQVQLRHLGIDIETEFDTVRGQPMQPAQAVVRLGPAWTTAHLVGPGKGRGEQALFDR